MTKKLFGREVSKPRERPCSCSSITSKNGSGDGNFTSEPEKDNPVELIQTSEPSECQFCFADLKPQEGVMLNSCRHTFCQACIKTAVEGSPLPQIPCPIATETGCKGVFLDPEVKALLSAEKFEEYVNRSLTLAEDDLGDVFKCRNTECNAFFSIPESLDVVEYLCPNCEYVNCLVCKVLSGGSGCRCRKRNADGYLESSGGKVRRIDPELKKGWDCAWEQLSKSFQEASFSSQASTLSSSKKSVKNHTKSCLFSLLDSSDLVKATQEFECSICMTLVATGEGVILKDCFHMFCKECLVGTVVNSEDAKVKCPFQINDYACTSCISDREVKALVSPEIHEKYLARSVNQAEMGIGNSYHCKTVNCTGWCEFEEDVPEFHCPVCLKRNCLVCKAIHENRTCLQYQAQLQEDEMDLKTKKMLKTLFTQKKAMKCPTCKVIIQKISGCDGVNCTVCKTQICWATLGPRWGPKGRGDTSGGCRCRCEINKYKMCHPKCKGCH